MRLRLGTFHFSKPLFHGFLSHTVKNLGSCNHERIVNAKYRPSPSCFNRKALTLLLGNVSSKLDDATAIHGLEPSPEPYR